MRKKTMFFIIAVLIQLVILASVPAKKYYTLNTGTTVTLKPIAYDPYDILSGYYLRLNYDISMRGVHRPRRIEQGDDQPPLTELEKQFLNLNRGTVYGLLVPDPNSEFYKLDSLSNDMPEKPGPDKVVIKGFKPSDYRGIEWGIEKYYIPETQRKRLDKKFRENMEDSKVYVKVDKFGNPAIKKIVIAGEQIEY